MVNLRGYIFSLFSRWNIIQEGKFSRKVYVSDDSDQKKSQKVLAELENIDDECDQNDIAFVKIDNKAEAKEYGIDEFPTLVYFERRIPHIYDGMQNNDYRESIC